MTSPQEWQCRLRIPRTGGRWCVLAHGHDGPCRPDLPPLPLDELVACWQLLDRMARQMLDGSPGRHALSEAQHWVTMVMARHYGVQSWARLVPDWEPMPTGDAFVTRYYLPGLESRGD